MADTLFIQIDAGSDWWLGFQLLEDDDSTIDLTGCTVRMYLKRKFKDVEAALELTTENGRITITPEDGMIELSLDEETTAELNGQYHYDIDLMNPSGSVDPLFSGKIQIKPQVTR